MMKYHPLYRLKRSLDAVNGFLHDTAKIYRDWGGRWGLGIGILAALISCMQFFSETLLWKFWWIWVLLATVLFVLQCRVWCWWSKKECLQSTPERSPWFASLFIALFTAVLYIARLLDRGIVESFDTVLQWQQVQSGCFDDWHPVMHTCTLYLLSRIWENVYFVAGCFIAVFGGLCGWFYYSMRKWGVRLWLCWLVILFLVISPVSMFAMRVLWKDSAFMLTLLAIGIAMMNLYFSGGKWLEKLPNQCLLVFLLVYGSFVRHNGIFFTWSFILLLPLMAENRQLRRKFIILSCITAALCAGYIGGRSVLLKHHIIKPNDKPQTFHESVGIPMSMMTHAFVTAPEKLPPEVIDFMTQVMPWEKWKEYYTGDFNSVKFNAPGNLMGDISKKEFTRLFIMTLQAAPQESLYAMKHVTAVAWDPVWNSFGDMEVIHSIEQKYPWLPVLKLGWLWTAPGLYVWLLMILTLFLLPVKGGKVLFMSLPFIVYNYGTALLLMGWDQRFFWGVIIGSLPVLIALATAGNKKRLCSK